MERLTHYLADGKTAAEPKNRAEGLAFAAKLAAYEDAEENGMLIMLPCKVGDERYFITYDGFIQKGTIRDIQIVLTTDFYEEVFYISGVSREKWIGRDGMYRTREEAEEALKERESDNG